MLSVPCRGILSLPRSRAADKGDPFSPAGWWHPRYKQPVAQRLAATTQRDVYGQKHLIASGPTLVAAKPLEGGGGYALAFGAAEAQGLTLRPTVNCSYVAKLLKATYGTPPSDDSGCCAAAPPFEVLGESGAWAPASAELSNGKVVVKGGGGGGETSLRGVRYGWADYPLCMVYNSQGIVASPFIRAGCAFDPQTKFTSWPMLDNTRGAAKAGASSGVLKYLGTAPSALACAEKAVAAKQAQGLKSYVWFSADFTQTKGNFSSGCYGRTDGFWHPINGCPNGDPGCGKHNVTSGQLC